MREDESVVGLVDPCRVAVDVAYGKLILSCWDEGWSRSWRVVSGQFAAKGLTLDCTRRIGIDRCLLHLDRGPAQPAPLRPNANGAWIRSLVESNLAGVRVERVELSRDDRRKLSGQYSRLILRTAAARNGQAEAAIVATEDKDQAVIDGALAAGLIWADALRMSGQVINRLSLFLPRGRASATASRLTAITGQTLAVRLYEIDETERSIELLSPYDQGDLADNLKKAADGLVWPEDMPSTPETDRIVSSVVAIAPEFITAQSKDSGISLSIRGLEFARTVTGEPKLYFGIGPDRKLLDLKANGVIDGGSMSELRRLVWRIISERTAHSDDRNSDIYRMQSERWLESIVMGGADAIDPNIDPRYMYSQVPVCKGEEKGYIDLLAATRSGRLVVIELKTAEDGDFPFQGLDYWLRARWHAERGDFQRRGYFQGLQLTDESPLVYLVAPLFRFHRSTALIASSISERVPIYRVGINEDWRSGIKVLLRERLN